MREGRCAVLETTLPLELGELPVLCPGACGAGEVRLAAPARVRVPVAVAGAPACQRGAERARALCVVARSAPRRRVAVRLPLLVERRSAAAATAGVAGTATVWRRDPI